MIKINEGNYGAIYLNPSNNHVFKILKPGKTWGTYELQLGKRMGDIGHSPEVYSYSPSYVEMEFVEGKPLWGQPYNRTEEEKERDLKMSVSQALKAINALRDLHLMGFYHGDIHNSQFLTDGEGGEQSVLIDYGLSAPIKQAPHKALVDYVRIFKLAGIDRPEFDSNHFIIFLREKIASYREFSGSSKKSVLNRSKIAQDYAVQLQNFTV